MNQVNAAVPPPSIDEALNQAKEKISGYFENVTMMPEKGKIEIDGMRFMWTQAKGLAVVFRNTIAEIYGEKGAEQILYKFGRSLGINEAKEFHRKYQITDPMLKFAHGPAYFAYSGWALVDVLPSSAPQQNEDYILTYNHPGSFEAEALIQARIEVDHPICFINAGYSSGWCSESFSLPLEAREMTCEAAGDAHCTFIMTHRNMILKRSEKMRQLLKSKKPHEITTEELL